jgi:hypothetical protein
MTEVKVCAVDPGLTGAIVLFHGNSEIGLYAESFKMPVKTIKTNDPEYSLNVLDIDKFRSIICNSTTIITERITPYAHDSRKSSFSFGGAYHTMMASIDGTKLNTMTIDPKAWKKAFGLIGTKKEASIDRAKEIMHHFPLTMINLNKTKVLSIAIADAYLIGMYFFDMCGIVDTKTIVKGIKVKQASNRQSVVES